MKLEKPHTAQKRGGKEYSQEAARNPSSGGRPSTKYNNTPGQTEYNQKSAKTDGYCK